MLQGEMPKKNHTGIYNREDCKLRGRSSKTEACSCFLLRIKEQGKKKYSIVVNPGK